MKQENDKKGLKKSDDLTEDLKGLKKLDDLTEDLKKEEKKEIEVTHKEKNIMPPKKIDHKPKSLMEEIAEVKESLKALAPINKTDDKKKKFKLPLNVKRQTKNLKKLMMKNKVQVIMLKSTGAIQTTIGEINAGRLIVGENYYNAAADIIWHWNGNVPTAIVCDWDMQPLTKSRLMEETDSLKTWLHPQTITIRAMIAKMAGDKLPGARMKPAVFIALGVIALVVYYLFVGGAP